MLSAKKNQLTLLYRVLSLCCFICLRNMIQSPWCSLVLLRSPHILFSSNFVCYYLQSIELKLFKPTRTNRFPFFHLTWTVTYIVSLPLYWEVGYDKRWNLWEHLTFNTFVPSIFMTSVHPPPPHASSPCLVMWQYTGIFADPTSSKYALFSLDLLKHSTLMITPSLFLLKLGHHGNLEFS